MRLPSESNQQLFLKSLAAENAVLHSGLGVMLAVAGTETAAQAFFLGSAALALILLNGLVSALAGDLLQRRAPVWLLVVQSALAVALIGQLFRDRLAELPAATGVLLAALAVSPIVFSRARNITASMTIGRSLFDSAGSGTGVVAVLVALGSLREMLGRGTVGQTRLLAQPPAPWMGTLLGGVLLCAAAITLFRVVRARSAA